MPFGIVPLWRGFLLMNYLLSQAPVTTQQMQEIEGIIQEVIKRDEAVYVAEAPLMLVSSIQGLRTTDEVQWEGG